MKKLPGKLFAEDDLIYDDNTHGIRFITAQIIDTNHTAEWREKLARRIARLYNLGLRVERERRESQGGISQ